MKFARQGAVLFALMSACGSTSEEVNSSAMFTLGSLDGGNQPDVYTADDDIKQGVSPLPSTKGIVIGGRTFSVEQVIRFAPVLFLHEKKQYLPCSIDHILNHATINDGATVVVSRPTQQDLITFRDPKYHVQIDPVAFPGEPPDADKQIRAPMYVFITPNAIDQFVDLTFVFLYGYNGAQTIEMDLGAFSYRAQLKTLGEHQGDLEAFTVRVNNDLTQIISLRFEAHGDSTFMNRDQVRFLSGTDHALVSVTFSAHGTHPAPAHGDALVVEQAESKFGIGVDFDDFYSATGLRWAPFDIKNGVTVDVNQLVFVGYDANKLPLNDQLWVAFQGRIGGHQDNSFVDSVGVYSKLNCAQHCLTNVLAKVIWGCMTCCCGNSSTVQGYESGDGPVGLASRDFIYVDTRPKPDAG